MTNTPIPAGLDAAVAQTTLPESAYSTLDALDIAADNRPQPEEVWGGLQYLPGQIMEIIGGSGLGKSRIVLNLAICQVLGRPFAGLPTMKRPLTWLFFGNENSFFRFRHDLRKMLSILSADDRERLRGHIYLPSMQTAADAFVSFTDVANVKRLKATMRLRQPDVLVLDPWGAIIDGDELNDGDVRRTITTIVDILSTNPGKTAVAIVLNHSRNGLKELIDAAGAGKANYGKNSKAIYSVVRCVWNLRPAHFDEPATKIELIHAKSSDIKPYPPVAIELNQDSFHYRADTTFDHAVWQTALEKAYRSHSTLTQEERVSAGKSEDDEKGELLKRYVADNGPIGKSMLVEWCHQRGWTVRDRQQQVENLINNGTFAEITENASSRKIIGLPEQILVLKSKNGPDFYR